MICRLVDTQSSGRVFWELGISFEKSRASYPTGCLSYHIVAECPYLGPICWH